MSETRVAYEGAGRYSVSGPMTFDTVHTLIALPPTDHSGPITVDLGGVPRADSAGLALMLEWLRQARQDNRTLTFTHVPARLQDLIAVSGLSALFGDQPA